EVSPRPTSMDDLGLVKTVDRFGESVVITVADTADRRLDASLRQSLRIANGHILGGFNRSSQHWVIVQISDIRSRLQLVSSRQGFFGACCSECVLRLESLGQSSATGRCPSGSIAAKGR